MENKNHKDKIDFVITWVDCNDIEWQKEKAMYKGDAASMSIQRYRDWENLQYIFRGIEKYAPWVNQVYFVTCGQKPEWLNENHPKLKLVSHKDYMDNKYLPTFNSNPIELCLSKLEGLSEHFVLFNDDTFICNKVEPEDFFVDGKPCDMFMEYPIGCSGHNEIMSNVLANTFNTAGHYFTRKQLKREMRDKILSPKYGPYFFYNLIMYMMPFPNFFGLLTPHLPCPHLKSTFKKMWEMEYDKMDTCCMQKFRSKEDINHYLMRIYNIATGNFVPKNRLKMGKSFFIHEEDKNVYSSIEHQKYRLICVNDDCSDDVFEVVKRKVNASFEKLFPEKSSFEL